MKLNAAVLGTMNYPCAKMFGGPGNMSKKALMSMLFGSAAALSLMSGPVMADATSDEIQALRARLDKLEKAQSESAAKAAAAPAPSSTNGPLNALAKGQPVRIIETSGTDITLFGLLEASISTISNSDAKGRMMTGFQPAWFSGNRWGVTGKQELDKDSNWNLIAKLESEFVLPNGASGSANYMFNRDAWVGFEQPSLGKLTFGRQNTLVRDFTQTYADAYGSSQLTTTEGGFTNQNNFKHLVYYSGGAGSTNVGSTSSTASGGTRFDNSVVWKKVWDNGLVTGLGYELGGVQGGGLDVGSAEQVSVGYNGGKYTVSASYARNEVQQVGAGSSDRGLLHQSESVGGSYQIIPELRVQAGYFHYSGHQGLNSAGGVRQDNAYTVSFKVTPAGKWEYDLGWQFMKAQHAAYKSTGVLFNPFADASANSAMKNAAGQYIYGSGDKETLYASIFYHATSNTDLYIAGDYAVVHGGYGAAGGTAGTLTKVNGTSIGRADQAEGVTGVRWKF